MNSTRRDFLKNSGVLLAGAGTTRWSSYKQIPPSDTIRVALIGCGGMGFYNLKDHLKISGVECVALCDVDDKMLNEKGAELAKITSKKPLLFKDYRKILDDKSIDAVIVATPDHWHCLPTVHACEARKDVYVEKPLANSIAECDVMVSAARKYSRIVQVGQQQRSGQHWQDAIAVVKEKKIGKLRKIKAWGFFDYGKAAPKVPDSSAPAGFDFNTWLGPAPLRQFNTGRFHGNWRFSWDYGGGLLTDWGVHLLDVALWAVDGELPTSVASVGGIYAYPGNAIETADTQTALFSYKDLLIEWEHAGGLNKGYFGRGYGVAFIGNDGTLVINREGWEIIPQDENGKPRMEATSLQPADRQDHEKHVANFIACVRNRKVSVCDVDTGRRAATLAHMGNIAYRTGDNLQWNNQHHNFTNNAGANEFLTPHYRAPWVFPVM